MGDEVPPFEPRTRRNPNCGAIFFRCEDCFVPTDDLINKSGLAMSWRNVILQQPPRGENFTLR